MKNLFNKSETNEIVNRINNLTSNSVPLWGKMNVSQMLAHCNVSYELVFTNNFKRPNAIKKVLLKAFVKKSIVSIKPYAKNSFTAPEFIISNQRVFEAEKQKLIDFINKTQQLGETHFEGKDSHSFGKLSSIEWNNMFTKHLEHHLSQFGV